VTALDRPRRWLRRTSVHVGPDAAGPFTANEVHQLAFGLPEQWVGIINRDRWCEHGAVVIEAWQTRVEAEQVQYGHASGELETGNGELLRRSVPWPVAFYGQPDTSRHVT
jgi:hypothetical protein